MNKVGLYITENEEIVNLYLNDNLLMTEEDIGLLRYFYTNEEILKELNEVDIPVGDILDINNSQHTNVIKDISQITLRCPQMILKTNNDLYMVILSTGFENASIIFLNKDLQFVKAYIDIIIEEFEEDEEV